MYGGIKTIRFQDFNPEHLVQMMNVSIFDYAFKSAYEILQNSCYENNNP